MEKFVLIATLTSILSSMSYAETPTPDTRLHELGRSTVTIQKEIIVPANSVSVSFQNGQIRSYEELVYSKPYCILTVMPKGVQMGSAFNSNSDPEQFQRAMETIAVRRRLAKGRQIHLSGVPAPMGMGGPLSSVVLSAIGEEKSAISVSCLASSQTQISVGLALEQFGNYIKIDQAPIEEARSYISEESGLKKVPHGEGSRYRETREAGQSRAI